MRLSLKSGNRAFDVCVVDSVFISQFRTIWIYRQIYGFINRYTTLSYTETLIAPVFFFKMRYPICRRRLLKLCTE